MSTNKTSSLLKEQTRKFSAWMQAAVIASAGLLPMLSSSSVSALQLTDRSLLIGTSEGSATGVDYEFTFDIATTGNVGSVEIDFCTTPLGTCTTPTGFDASSATLTLDEVNDVDSDFVDGTMAAGQIQVTRGGAASLSAGDTLELDFSGVDNPDLSAPYTSFYARITTFSDLAYTTAVDNGVVAAAVTQQLIVNGRVQERLEFCVAALTDAAATPADCAAFPTVSTIDIGVIQETLAVSPVVNDGFNGANDSYGAAMVDTNASGGVVVTYFPEADTGTNQLRNFRVPGSTACSATESDTDDPCFQSAATTGTDLSGAGERFGMQVACVDRTESENTTANLLNNNTSYYADNNDGTCQDTEANTTFAWDNTGTPVTIASSTSVVNDEMLKLRFGARAAATTPTGSYSVTTTYVATATF